MIATALFVLIMLSGGFVYIGAIILGRPIGPSAWDIAQAQRLQKEQEAARKQRDWERGW